MGYDTIIFDMDGTLLDTLGDLMDAVNYALELHGCPSRTLDEIRRFVGNGVKLLVERSVPAGTDEAETMACLADFKDYYAQHMADKTAPYPGVLDLLAALRAQGRKLAVVSNKFDSAVKELCPRYFPGLLHAAAGENEAEGVPKKPHPAMVHRVLRELNADPAKAVYVGDSEVDLETARNAGLPCISVTWGFRDRDFLTAHGAATFAATPSQLLELL